MSTLWDSSEIKEAAALLNDLLGLPSKPPKLPKSKLRKKDARKEAGVGKEGAGGIVYRADRLEEALVSMCSRGEFSGSVLADDSGLPLAVYNSPVEDGILAAFTSVLGKSLAETGRLLDQPNANNISMDINYMDKIVLRKFFVDENPFFLMIISPQHVDERAEVELSVNQISAILKEPG